MPRRPHGIAPYRLLRSMLSTTLLLSLACTVCFARDEHGSHFEAQGTTIYYEVTGSGTGTPLVVVNGGPGFDHTYLHVTATSSAWDALGKNRRIVFYDQRGTGHSVSPASSTPGTSGKQQTYTLADQIDDLEALRAHLGFERIDLLGHSWGGFLVMAYSARYPNRIAHLTIVDSAAPVFKDTLFMFNNVFPEGVERQNSLAFAQELGDKDAADASLREYLKMLFYSLEKRDTFLASISTAVYNQSVNEAVNHDISRFDLGPEIQKFKFPVLVVTGRYDMNVAPLTAYKIHQAIPGSAFVVFERSGHLPFYEEPEEFAKTLEGFLNGR
jgi:proline iminopeptidase